MSVGTEFQCFGAQSNEMKELDKPIILVSSQGMRSVRVSAKE